MGDNSANMGHVHRKLNESIEKYNSVFPEGQNPISKVNNNWNYDSTRDCSQGKIWIQKTRRELIQTPLPEKKMNSGMGKVYQRETKYETNFESEDFSDSPEDLNNKIRGFLNQLENLAESQIDFLTES